MTRRRLAVRTWPRALRQLVAIAVLATAAAASLASGHTVADRCGSGLSTFSPGGIETCVTPSSSLPPSRPAATSTPVPPSSDLLPPQITLTEAKEEAFVVHFRYPQEGSQAPTDFEVLVDGELYETTDYMGTDFDYSRFVSDQPCGATLEVEIVAVNGDSRAPSGPAEAQTEPC